MNDFSFRAIRFITSVLICVTYPVNLTIPNPKSVSVYRVFTVRWLLQQFSYYICIHLSYTSGKELCTAADRLAWGLATCGSFRWNEEQRWQSWNCFLSMGKNSHSKTVFSYTWTSFLHRRRPLTLGRSLLRRCGKLPNSMFDAEEKLAQRRCRTSGFWWPFGLLCLLWYLDTSTTHRRNDVHWQMLHTWSKPLLLSWCW